MKEYAIYTSDGKLVTTVKGSGLDTGTGVVFIRGEENKIIGIFPHTGGFLVVLNE